MSISPHKVNFCDGALIGGQSGELHYINEIALWVLDRLGPTETKPDRASIDHFLSRFGGSRKAAEQAINDVLEWRGALGDAPNTGHHGNTYKLKQNSFLDEIRRNAQSCMLSINGQKTKLFIEDTAIFDLLKPMIAHLRIEQPEHDNEVILAGISGEENYKLYLNGECQSPADNFFSARHLVLEGLALASLESFEDCFAMLHAAAVVLDNKGIIILGPSGAGKTTLLLGLLANGAEFISDDIVPLSGPDAIATSIPFAIGVKQGSWDMAEALFDDLKSVRPIQLGDRCVKYVAPKPGGLKVMPDGHSIDLILMPEFVEGTSPELCRYSPLDALNSASEFGSWFNGRLKTLQYIADFFETTPASRIRYGSLDEALDLIGA